MEEIKNKIKELGLQEKEAADMFNLLTEEVLEIVFKDLADKSTDEELTVIENRIKESKSPEHFETILNEIAITVYGDNAQEEIKNIYLDLLDQFKRNVDEAKDLINKANSGDPDAQALLKKAEESEEYKNIVGQQPTSTDDSF
jgi:ABC-type antimicrobial peptide transport system permease subunit